MDQYDRVAIAINKIMELLTIRKTVGIGHDNLDIINLAVLLHQIIEPGV